MPQKAVVLTLAIFLLTSSNPVFGAEEIDLKSKIEKKSEEIEKIEIEIKGFQENLERTGQKAETLKKEVERLNLEIKSLNSQLFLTEKKISRSELKIKELESQIVETKISVNNQKNALAQSLREFNVLESQNAIEMLLIYDTVSDFFKILEENKKLNLVIENNLNDLNETKNILTNQKNSTEFEKKELASLKLEITDRKVIRDSQKKQQSSFLALTKNEEILYKKLYEDRLVKKEALEKEVFDYESQLKFILDPASLPLPGTSILSWPLDNIRITQLFGATVAAKRLYTSGSHNGVDFSASIGTPVKAMFNGTVSGTGDTDKTCSGASFGKWILLTHTNGLASTYAHLSLIKVNAGDSVSQGQIIGYSGNTGYSTGPHLHVSVYASSAVNVESRPSKVCKGYIYTMPISPINAYIDPMLYLPLYKI